jgi:hypothetical protein
LTSLVSVHTAARTGYTWRSDTSAFWPGHLDYQIYTDSVLDVGNHFLLYTPEMPADSLTRYGLQLNDSKVTDHVITCADYRPIGPADTVDNEIEPLHLSLAPNPSRGDATIKIFLNGPGRVSVEILDINGRIIAHPLGAGWIAMPEGDQKRIWDRRDDLDRSLPLGTYYACGGRWRQHSKRRSGR